MRIVFENTYARLPERFHARVAPARVPAPKLVKLNAGLAEFLGLDAAWLASAGGVEVLAGNAVAEGSEPLAMAYAGHQFGHFVPQLGDGRANLLGEVMAADGKRYDLQLKGSGRTPFSRGGDGKAALGPVLREYVVSEAMAAMGVPTTRALAAVVTGERVAREEMLPGAVLCRVAASHLRVGTFQYFAARGDTDGVKALADYAVARHYAEEAAGASNAYEALLRGVVGRHARLVARWMLLGFVHGVMNTDNTSISGETLDYGPCAFLEAYDPDTVFSSIDHVGRYRYSNQPGVAVWNLMRLAECLLPLLHADADRAMELAKGALEGFGPEYERARAQGLAAKVGVADGAALGEEFLASMAAGRVDFTLAWRRLADAAAGNDAAVKDLFRDAGFEAWMERWRAGLDAGSAERMRGANPIYIPRNHLVQAVIEAGVERGDFAPFEELLGVVTRPFEETHAGDKYARPAREHEVVRATFCGT